MIRTNHNPGKQFLTNAEIARILHVSRNSVYRWIKSGKLKAFQTPGGNYRILTKDFKKFLSDFGITKFFEHTLPRPSIKILIVDDDPKTVEEIKVFLEKANPHFYVKGATNGFAAGGFVFYLQPDIVILDLIMPGINSFELCRQIKSEPFTKNIKVIAITKNPTKRNIQRIKKEGANACLAKPVNYTKLLDKINTLTRK